MKTADQKVIREVLDDAEKSAADLDRGLTAFYFLAQALVLAVCLGVDELKQIVADLPSHK